MKFIVQNPLTFLKYLIENIYRLLRSDTFVYGRTGFTSIGNGMGVGKNVVARDMIPFLLIWYIITDKRKSPGINLARRAFVYLYTACGIAIICTTLYMNYSEVGVAFFFGINPLYLLTLMFPLFYYLRSNKIKTIFDYRKYNVITYGLWVLVLYASIYTRVICNYMT